MEKKLTVEILEGKHSRPAPTGTRNFFKQLLKDSGIKKGVFKILLGKQIRGADKAKRIIVHNIDQQTGTILMKAQINGKRDQRFEMFLTLPNQFKQRPEIFFKALKRGERLINNPSKIKKQEKVQEEDDNFEKFVESKPEKIKVSQKSSKRIGFNHLISDEDSVYLFWLEIKEIFGNDGQKMVSRKFLIENFLINYGHSATCYKFIAKLIEMNIFSETETFSGKRRYLTIGSKLKKIISKIEKRSPNSKKNSFNFKKVKELQILVSKKNELESLILEKEATLKNLEEDLNKLKAEISLEMQQAEEKLDALNKLLG